MSWFGKLDGLQRAARGGILGRMLAVLLGGTLNQKVIAVLGLSIMVGSLFWLITKLWLPMLLGVLGGAIVMMAVKDYERMLGRPL